MECMSWLIKVEDLLLSTITKAVFNFFMSLRFPNGKLGCGPKNPFSLSFFWARTGNIQQHRKSLKNITPRTTTETLKNMYQTRDTSRNTILISSNMYIRTNNICVYCYYYLWKNCIRGSDLGAIWVVVFRMFAGEIWEWTKWCIYRCFLGSGVEECQTLTNKTLFPRFINILLYFILVYVGA